jgi:hypothetical protein
MNRHKQVLNLLKERGKTGLTVKECMQLGAGTELRKVVSDLVKQGYNIKDKWVYRSGRRFKKYFFYEREKIEFKPLPKTKPLTGDTKDKWQAMGQFLKGQSEKPLSVQIMENLI